MLNITLDNQDSFINLTTLSQISTAVSTIITNNSSFAMYVTHDILTEGFPVYTGQSVQIAANFGDVFIKGDGNIVVQELYSSVQPYTVVDLPHDIYTSTLEKYRRLRVDVAQTGFFEGREFRTFKEFSIATGASYVVKFVCPIDFILFQQSIVIDDGAIKMTATVGGTPGGVFSDTLPIIGKNQMVKRPLPYYTPVTTITAGGTVTGGTVVEIIRVMAAGATAQRQTVGGSQSDERGLAAGTYIIELANVGTGTATGVYSIVWEERP